MKKNNYGYSSLAGLKFIDEDGNEMDAADAMHQMEKAKSFDGDRSAAGRYAALARWGNRGASASSTHGLATEHPVIIGPNGNLLVEYLPNRFRLPTALERGAPTAADFSQSIDSDLKEFRRLHSARNPNSGGYIQYPERDKAVEDQIASAKRNITSFHRVYDDSGRGWDTRAANSSASLSMNVLRLRNTAAWDGPAEKIVLERIITKIEAVQQNFNSLQTPAMP